MTIQPIDLSKYAAGRKLRCTCRESAGLLTYGREYASRGINNLEHVIVGDDNGHASAFHPYRFAPVEDEAPVCLCGPQYNRGINRSCPEHGPRCDRPGCGKLCDGADAWQLYAGQTHRYCSRPCRDLMHPDLAAPRPAAANRLCASCAAPFTPAPVTEYKDTTRCVYCQCRAELPYVDDRPALSRALPDRTPKRSPSKHDARPIDLDAAWQTPGWES